MFKKILFPTDFSEPSEKALQYVKKMKEAGAETVIILHVIDKREIKSMTTMEGFSSMRYEEIQGEVTEELKEKATPQLAKIFAELHDLGFQVDKKLMIGVPFQEIITVAEAEAVSCIVIGSHGKSLVKEMLLGSTSEKVIRKANVPILVVK